MILKAIHRIKATLARALAKLFYLVVDPQLEVELADPGDLPGKNRSRSNVISGPRKGSGNAKEEVHGRGNHYASSDS